jgi:hypothetical protein
MDTTAITSDPKTWVDFAFYVFDKAWPLLGTALGGFLAGWLGVNKPGFMKRGKNVEG